MKNELLTLAAYHAWAFETLYAALRPLGDAQYRGDCGLFFRSIHGTLNHLLLADRVWFGRLEGIPYAVSGLDAELESDRAGLEHALCTDSRRWRDWLQSHPDDDVAGVLRYGNLSGKTFAQPLRQVLLHVFNHGTHHRGQVSAAISNFGLAVPEMDLILYLREASPAAT